MTNSNISGPAPRDVYPCVIVLISQNSALVTVFHIKDEQCSLPSQVLSHTTLKVTVTVFSSECNARTSTQQSYMYWALYYTPRTSVHQPCISHCTVLKVQYIVYTRQVLVSVFYTNDQCTQAMY